MRRRDEAEAVRRGTAQKEFTEMVVETQKKLDEVLARQPTKGGVLGKTRLEAQKRVIIQEAPEGAPTDDNTTDG